MRSRISAEVGSNRRKDYQSTKWTLDRVGGMGMD